MNISSIRESQKCMSCGLCASICPRNAIHMEYVNHEGFYRPFIDNDLCVDCGLCKKRCPADNQKNNSIMGNYSNIYLAHSTDNAVRHEATSGGCIHSLVEYLLDRGLVDGVLMVGYDKASPIEAGAYFVTACNRKAFQTSPRDFASRYVSVPVLAKLKENKELNKIAVIGTPCQILALTLCGGGEYNGIDIFKIGIACSGGMSYKATEQYKHLQSMDNSKMFYRGNGWPGTNCLITDEKEIECPHQGSLFERMFSSQIFKNPGCRDCRDHFAETADISFCDFWNKEELSKESEGNSCVIVRSIRAKNYFDMSVADGYIETVNNLQEEQVTNTQLNVLKSKKGNLRDSGRYKAFTKFCDLIFSTGWYRFLNLRMYRRICSYYSKICRTAEIDLKY